LKNKYKNECDDMNSQAIWTEEAEVVVVGYGGAGAVAAITAFDGGAKVLILEKQPNDSLTQTRHTPSTRMSGGGWFWNSDVDSAIQYMEGLAKIANEPLDAERKEQIAFLCQYLESNMDWMKKAGIPIGNAEDIHAKWVHQAGTSIKEGKVFRAEFPEIPGSECCSNIPAKPVGKYTAGRAFFKHFADAIQKRRIPVLWETPAKHLINEGGEIRGVEAVNKGKTVRIKASRAVILTCGGFEYNEWMKENYLRVYPVHFTGNPANTGDGINMALEVGAALWHMNKASWRAVLKFPDYPAAFSTQHHATSSIFVDKWGRRFTNERYKGHSFGYELTNYDCSALCYPKVPFWWIFDEKRRALAPLPSDGGACHPPGGVMGDIFYLWSEDNQKEIDRGWILKSNTIEGLAKQILADPDNNGLMTPSVLQETINRYNQFHKTGVDYDFNKGGQWLQPLQDAPYYAVKLWPGGPNTQGGPKRNLNGQIVRPDNTPIPRLYSAGELGSFYGMLYPVGGGNNAESIAFGRISGTNAAAEKMWT
jgi:succinate dehydrogenase/fumarate reductase flavoprotein subunit